MRRIRNHNGNGVQSPEILSQDLCRVFFMLLESDEKNAKLLFAYARLPEFLITIVRLRLEREHYDDELQNSPLLVLLLWVLWLTSTYDSILSEDQQTASKLQNALFPYVISAWLFRDYPPATSSLTVYTLSVFSLRVNFKLPLLSAVAFLSFCSRADAYLLRHWSNQEASGSRSQHLTEAVARARRLLSSSVAGLDVGYSQPLFCWPSERFDDDWARLECEFISSEQPLKMGSSLLNIHRLITLLSGIWEGRMEHPSYEQYMLLREARRPPSSAYDDLFITSLQLLVQFQVFYCTKADGFLRLNDSAEGALNAWFPAESEIDIAHMRSGGIHIWDKINNKHLKYQIFDPMTLGPRHISDVVLIGNSLPFEARYIGRVRLSDGLIMIVRDGRQGGKELLRGYVHQGDKFVGRWRTTSSPAQADTWEGPFVLCRRENVPSQC